METKKCTWCFVEQNVDQFAKRAKNKDGLYSWCHGCVKIKRKEQYEKRKLKTDKIILTEKRCGECKVVKSIGSFYKDAASNDGHARVCKDCNSARGKEWAKNNKELKDQRRKEWFDKNPGKRTEITARYRAKNPEKFRKYDRDRRAREFGQMGYVPDNYWQLLIDEYGELCLKCGHTGSEDNKLTLDHVVPLSHGTEETKLHDIDNFQILCHKCNSGKQASHADYRPYPPNFC